MVGEKKNCLYLTLLMPNSYRMPYQRLEKPEPMAVPMEIEPEEETKIPSVAEARARFDTTDAAPPKKVSKIDFKPAGPPKVPVAARVPVEAKVPPKPVPEFIPKKTFPPVEKPVPKPEPAKPEQPVRITKKSPSPRCLAIYLLSML